MAERRATAPTCSSSEVSRGHSAAAPSSLRPVLARKTSSSEGWCSCSVSTRTSLPSSSAHDLGELGLAARELHGHAAAPVALRCAEAAEQLGEPCRRRARRRPASTSTLGLPISAFSCAGVPSATILPRSMIPIRSASASASSRYWVVRKTVMPSSRARSRDLLPQRRAALGVEAGRRLVEEQDARLVHQRQREVEAPLHPAGVAADAAVGGFGQPDPLEQLVGARACGCFDGMPWSVRLQRQVLAAGQDRVERGLLQRGADRRAHLRALAHDVEAADRGAPARRRQQRREHQHGGRLARAVGAEEAVDLARADRRGRSRRPRAVPCGTRARARAPRSLPPGSLMARDHSTKVELVKDRGNQYNDMGMASPVTTQAEQLRAPLLPRGRGLGAPARAAVLRAPALLRGGRRVRSAPRPGRALMQLEGEAGLPMHEIATRLACDNSNVTGIVDRLEAAGWWRAVPASTIAVSSTSCRRDSAWRCATRCARGCRARRSRSSGFRGAEQRQLRDLLARALRAGH